MSQATTKRNILTFYDMVEMRIQYHNFVPITDGEKMGTRYVLTNPLTTSQRADLRKFDNTTISECYHKYAPEIRYDTLIIWETD